MLIQPQKKYKILIRLVVVRRDYSTFGLLTLLLKELGCKVLIVSSMNFTLALRLWKPDAVIVHNLASGKVANKIIPNVKIFFLDTEGFRVERLSHAKFFLDKSDYMKFFSNFFFWGNRIIREFKKFAPNLDISKIKIIGNPKLDMARYYEKNKFKVINKTIGISTRFHVLNNHIGRPAIFSLANNPEKYSYTDNQIKTFITLMDIMKKILKETDYKISIRVHPFEAIQGYQDNLKRWFGENNLERFEIDESLDFSEWVVRQRVVITPTTTAITECYLLNVPVINIDKIAKVITYNKNRDKVVNDWFKGVYLPNSISECLKMIKRKKINVKRNKIIDKMLIEYCDWHTDDYAAKISLNHILSQLNESVTHGYKLYIPYFFMKKIISLIDRFRIFKNPLFKNFNYSSYFHSPPLVYRKVKEEILKEN